MDMSVDSDAPTTKRLAAHGHAGGMITVKRGQKGRNLDRPRQIQRGLRIASPFLLLLAWEALSRSSLLDPRFFPAPSMIVGTTINMLENGSLAEATGITIRRVLLGYVSGALLGIVVGLWLGLSSWSRAVFEPWIQFTYPIPKLAVYPLLLLLVGTGELPMVLLLAIATFYIVVLSTIAAVLSISPTMIDVGKDLNANFHQFFRTIALPGSMPQIVTSLELSLGIAFILVIAVEFLGAGSGLGFIMWSSWQVFEIKPMYVALVVITVTGFLSVMGVRFLGRALMPWQK
jgi:ABC-type nitrate/sulfonate/bicarbonate transport system permease component